MNPEKILYRYEEHVERWLKELHSVTPADFMHPNGDGWSMSQVVDHICKTTQTCLQFAQQCAEGKGEKGHAGFGPFIFSSMGSFPPVRLKIKTPPKGVEHVYTPVNISLAQAKLALLGSLEDMRNAVSKIKTADKGMRIKHWAGGWFNAAQWFQNAEMHIKHHFRQLKRIKKSLQKK